MKKLLAILLFVMMTLASNAQLNLASIGTEVQWYPAGFQFLATGEIGLSDKDALHVRLGYNLADRKDFSPYNDNEKGGGFGGTLGYRHYFSQNVLSGFYVGGRVDIWGLAIDWQDADQIPNSGTTNITVLQPTAEIGYLYQFEGSPFAVGVNAAGGWEINVITNGEEVGQGRISLLGIIFNYRFIE